MCGRFTNKLTWEDVVRLYRLTLNVPPHNLRPRYNICPTDTIDTIVFEHGVRSFVPVRWGLVPRWWSKPLKEIKLATFNARAETVVAKPFFRDAFKRTRCLIPISGYFEWQDTPGGKQPWYFTANCRRLEETLRIKPGWWLHLLRIKPGRLHLHEACMK
jgi:putative SOS response-associated peptidase YedK